MYDISNLRLLLKSGIKHGTITSVNSSLDKASVDIDGVVYADIPIITGNGATFARIFGTELYGDPLTYSDRKHLLYNINKTVLVLFGDRLKPAAIIGFVDRVPLFKAGFMAYDEEYEYTGILQGNGYYQMTEFKELETIPQEIISYYDPRDFFYENTQMSWENTYPIPADWGQMTDATIENGMLKDKGLDYFTGLNVQWFGTYETDQGLKYGPLSGYYPYEQEPTPDVAITSAAWKDTITFLTMDAFTAEITPEDTLSESLTEYYSSLPADDKWRFVRLGRIFLDLAAHPFVMNSQWDSVRGYITDHLNNETMFVSYDPSPFFAELMSMLTPSFILSYAVSVKENPRNYEFMSSAMKYACGLHYTRLTSTAPDGSEAEKYNLTWQMPYFKYTLFQNAEGGWVYRLDRSFAAETAVLGEEHYTSRTISEFGSAIRYEMVYANSLYYSEFAPPYTQTEPVNVDSSVFVCNGEILHDTSTDTAGWYDFMPLNIGGEYRFWFVYHGEGETRFSEAKENETPVTVTLDGNMEGPYLFFPVA